MGNVLVEKKIKIVGGLRAMSGLFVGCFVSWK